MPPTATPTDTPGGPTATPTPTLCDLAGDLNQDGVVDILDLTIVSNAYGSALGDPLYEALADVDDDGDVDLFDLVSVAREFGASCPGVTQDKGSGVDDATAVVRPEVSDLAPPVGEELGVEVWAENVAGLCGFQFELEYDPTQLELLEVSEGTFLEGDDGGVEVLTLPPDVSEPGVVKPLASVRLSGGQGAAGSGALVNLRFTVKGTEANVIEPRNVILSNTESSVLPVRIEGVLLNGTGVKEWGRY